MQPAQQQGRRIPPLSFERPFLIRISLVSAFLPDVTQQIHSLRASGVISSHAAFAVVSDISAFRKSVGTLCTAPPDILFLVIRLFYRQAYHENVVNIKRDRRREAGGVAYAAGFAAGALESLGASGVAGVSDAGAGCGATAGFVSSVIELHYCSGKREATSLTTIARSFHFTHPVPKLF